MYEFKLFDNYKDVVTVTTYNELTRFLRIEGDETSFSMPCTQSSPTTMRASPVSVSTSTIIPRCNNTLLKVLIWKDLSLFCCTTLCWTRLPPQQLHHRMSPQGWSWSSLSLSQLTLSLLFTSLACGCRWLLRPQTLMSMLAIGWGWVQVQSPFTISM